MSKLLPMPPFFDPANASNWNYDPNMEMLRSAAHEWRKVHGLSDAVTSDERVLVVDIDSLRDFCHPQGALFVGGRSGTGAIEDSVRTATFIYRELAHIDSIMRIFDTHEFFHIHTPSFWQYADGTPISANTVIPLEFIAGGQVEVVPAMANLMGWDNASWLNAYVIHYAMKLEREGKKTLIAWAPHAIIGTSGHAQMGTILEATAFHAYARRADNRSEIKGGEFLSECFSALGPEVCMTQDGMILDDGKRRTRLVEEMLDYDAVIFVGQAASHCVMSTIDDVITYLRTNNLMDLAKKFYVARDGMSAVCLSAFGGPDFTDVAEEAFDRYQRAGMNVVLLADPMETWPGIRLAT